MQIRPTYMLIIITILTLAAVWVDLPGHTLDPFGWKGEIKVHEGLDLQGGLQVVLEARPTQGQSVGSDELQGTRDTIERRVNALGVSEPLIQTRGSNQIIVELPGIDDPERAVQILKETALLEIIDPMGEYLPPGTIVRTTAEIETPPAPDATSPTTESNATAEASPQATPGAGTSTESTPLPTGPIYQTIITGADLADAFPTTDQFGTLVVGFELKSEAASRFYDYTSTHINQPMAIVVDKQVISTPVINDPIRDSGVISGMNASEVQELALQLKSGALEVPLEVVQSRTVGPTLGQDSIDKSLVAGLAGLSVVALFMILFYRVPGVLSVVALLIYTALTFALFKLIPVVLTLAGIAGFILSIGMAVDANVLIFSRLKEELRMGHTIGRAVEAGFDHAWPSIRDSNIATMITCAILYWFGRYTGASIIQGFALTLFIGVAVSMFTAITVTRTLLRVMLTRQMFHNQWWFGIESSHASAGAGD